MSDIPFKLTTDGDFYYFYVGKDGLTFSEPSETIIEAISNYIEEYGIAPEEVLGVLSSLSEDQYDGVVVWTIYDKEDSLIEIDENGEFIFPEPEDN